MSEIGLIPFLFLLSDAACDAEPEIFCRLRVGRSVQYSEDSEAGDGQRKRFRLSREEEETEAGIGEVKVKKKKKKKSWNDQEPSTSHALEVSYSEWRVLMLAAVFVDFSCIDEPLIVALSGVEGEARPRV